MKIPYEWLRVYCAPDLDLDTLAERLTLTGTKVDSVDGEVIELEITPNRPDCLGVYGVAREVHAATGAPLSRAPWTTDLGTPGPVADLAVTVDAPDLCPRFTARVFEDVQIGPSPLWLQDSLTAADQRPINNVVDITNYAMLLTGHPLHAFDLERVTGRHLIVRRALDGETVMTLDEQMRTLDSEMLLIADDERPTSIAGVMGGMRSEVHDGTTSVVMEAASWMGPNILRTSNALGLRSEASNRFAKSLAPEQAMDAQRVATQLMVELAGAHLLPGTIDVTSDPPASSPIVRLRPQRVGELLGQTIPRERQRTTLEALGFGVADAGSDELDVSVPPHRRNDVTREADLVEEVGRFALDDLPATLPRRRPAARLTVQQRQRRRALDALVGCGLHEAVGWSFTEPSVADRLRLPDEDPRRRFVVLENPMSDLQSALRTTLLGSLLDVARENVRSGRPDLRLFEAGTVYQRAKGQPLPDERRLLCVLLHGAVTAPSWCNPQPATNALPAGEALAAKGILEMLGQALRTAIAIDQDGVPEPFLHPGRSGRVLADGEAIGWIGALHPLVADAWDLGSTGCFELDLDRFLAHANAIPLYRDRSFPIDEQDLSVVVAADVPASRVLEIVRRHAIEAEVFDLFTGKQIAASDKSLAVRCAFRAPGRSQPDVEHVTTVRERIVQDLAEIGASIRS